MGPSMESLKAIQWPLSKEMEIKVFSYLVITSSISHVTQWVRYPHPESQRLRSKSNIRATELYSKNIMH